MPLNFFRKQRVEYKFQEMPDPNKKGDGIDYVEATQEIQEKRIADDAIRAEAARQKLEQERIAREAKQQSRKQTQDEKGGKSKESQVRDDMRWVDFWFLEALLNNGWKKPGRSTSTVTGAGATQPRDGDEVINAEWKWMADPQLPAPSPSSKPVQPMEKLPKAKKPVQNITEIRDDIKAKLPSSGERRGPDGKKQF